METVKLGILGFGNIGKGTYELLNLNRQKIQRVTGREIYIEKILVRDVNRDRGVAGIEKYLTSNPEDIIKNPEIDIVVEVLSGEKPAADYIYQALENGKHVVTANKAALAANFEKLTAKAEDAGRFLKFEASVAGGIPVLNPLSTVLQANEYVQVKGIVNGTTNYILSQMTENGARYEDVLKKAQTLGFAEADPTADVEGIDAANKLSILISLMFEQYVAPGKIPTKGITGVTLQDIEDAKEKGCVIKLIASAGLVNGKLVYGVKPELIHLSHPLAGVNNEFNAVYVEGNAVGELMFYGRGAGPLPTASAVMGDVMEICKTL